MSAPVGNVVSVSNVVKDYKVGRVIVPALRSVSLQVAEGEFLAIAGSSGSGKTTLLNLIGCIDQPSAGTIEIAGKRIDHLSERKRSKLRLFDIGFIFQTFNLVPTLDARQNVELPLLLQRQLGGRDRRARVDELLDTVGILAMARHRPSELSGGQQQRVAIARALVTRPKLVLADEPTANLDSVTGNQVVDLMRALNERHGITFIFSTHDSLIVSRATRTVELVDGKQRAPHDVSPHVMALRRAEDVA